MTERRLLNADDAGVAQMRDLFERVARLERRQGTGGEIICTSSTRPTVGLYRGMRIYETDTGNHLVYYGATTQWKRPWNSLWGLLDLSSYISVTTSGTAISVGADRNLTNLVANRLIKCTYMQQDSFGSTLADVFIVDATMDSTAFISTAAIAVDVVGTYIPPGAMSRFYTTTGTTHRFRSLCQRTGGSGTMTHRGYLLTEDWGPNGNAPAS